MPNKELRASVRLDVSNAEKSLKRLEDRIRNIDKLVNKQNSSTNGLTRGLDNAAKSANKLNQNIKKSGNSMGFLTKKVKALAAAYLGVMGARAAINTADTITSAENRLNNMPGGNAKLTQSTLDKTYAASQRSRGDYSTMLSNVGKTMTLAGDAFQNNVDNAVRFQEIMSKAYTVGGASAAEQSSSMYQLVQALGSGVLQGDELRSVREGAALAYKEIEKFAQGVFNSEKSLKDLASEGVITSDIVVAAIMDAESRINEAFENTDMTFAQVGNNIKNTAIKAFEPVLQSLNDTMNALADAGFLNVIGNILVGLGKAISWLFDLFTSFFNWCADNWYWLQWIVYSVITAMIIAFGIWAAKAVWAGLVSFYSFIMALSPLYQWIIIIGIVIAYLVYMANAAGSVCEFIYQVAMALAYAIVGFLLLVLGVYIATGTVMLSVPMMIRLLILAVLAVVVAAFVKYTGEVVGMVYGIGAVISAVCTNIGIAWQNMTSSMSAWFWNAIADMLDGCDWLIKGINKIREALNKDPIDVGSIRAKAQAASASGGKSYVDVGNAWSTGYKKGYAKGEAIQANINSWGAKLKSLGDKFSLNKLTSANGSLPGITDSAFALNGSYDPNGVNDDIANGLKKLGNIDDNTGSMADSMELTQEDMEYLRKIADMEWKKEFTTANITVDMSNYNTINGESDLDGIVTKLSDKLREEMNVLADGVYAY